MKMPIDDLLWVMQQKPAVIQLFHECWVSDPYGSRWVQLATKLKKSAFMAAKKRLSERGLFVFRPEASIRDGRSTVCWLVKNLHGSKVKAFWQELEGKDLESTAVDLESTAVDLESTAVDSISPQTCTQQGFQNPSRSYQDQDLISINNRAAQKIAVAAASEILEEEPLVKQLPAEVGKGKSVKPVNQPQPTAANPSGEAKQVSKSDSKSSVEGKFSAVQLGELKKLGIILNHHLKTLLAPVEAQQIDKAIACFKEDQSEWNGEMKNPTGWFIKVLRQVQEGRQPVQQQQSEPEDPIEAALEMWRWRWFNALPISRSSMAKDIATQFPGSEIIIRDFDEGPIREK